jgi:hypothetical protein
MSILTYNLCLLVIDSDTDVFSIISMQTDNILILRTAAFLSLEEKKI